MSLLTFVLPDRSFSNFLLFAHSGQIETITPTFWMPHAQFVVIWNKNPSDISDLIPAGSDMMHYSG